MGNLHAFFHCKLNGHLKKNCLAIKVQAKKAQVHIKTGFNPTPVNKDMVVENMGTTSHCSNDFGCRDKSNHPQTQSSKALSENGTIDCEGFVTLDNPLYDREFVFIQAGDKLPASDKGHPNALDFVSSGGKKVNLIQDVPPRLNAQQLAINSIKERANALLKPPSSIPDKDGASVLVDQGNGSVDSGGQFTEVVRKKRKTYEKRSGSASDGSKKDILDCFNRLYRAQKPTHK